jgi:hypothetical protein
MTWLRTIITQWPMHNKYTYYASKARKEGYNHNHLPLLAGTVYLT